jgi:hypothetical protein
LGAWIRLGNSSYLTDDYSNEGGTLVSAGFQTNLAINREFKSLQPKPYSNCELDSNSPFIQGLDLYNLISKSGYLYTQQLCFFQCYQKYLLEKNNCTESVFLSLFNAGSCYWEWAYFCDDDFTDELIDQHCITSCPLECDQISYRTSVSSSQLSTNIYYVDKIKSNLNLSSDFLNRTLNTQIARESIVEVQIFYESLSYSLTTRLKWTPFICSVRLAAIWACFWA